MASGQEMMMNTVLKMVGITTDDAKRDVAKALSSVLTIDARLDRIERNQRLIMAALNIEDSENGSTDRNEQPSADAKQLAAG